MNAREALLKLASSIDVIHEPMLDGSTREFIFEPYEHAHPKRVYVSTALLAELKKLPMRDL